MASIAPIMAYYSTTDLTTPMTNLSYGEVDAGSESTEFSYIIFNNAKGTTATSDAVGCRLTSKDTDGGMDKVILIREQWLNVKCDTLNETDYTPVGADYIPAIGGNPEQYNEVSHNISGDIPSAVHSATAPASPTDGMIWYDTSNALGIVPKKYDLATTTWKPYYVLQGKANDGTLANSVGNFSLIKTKCVVPSSALAGLYQWRTRIRYSFV